MIGLLFLLIVMFVGWYVFFRNRPASATANESPDQKVEYPSFIILALALVVLGLNVFLYGTETTESFPSVGIAGFNLLWVVATILMFRKKYSLLSWVLAGISVFAGLGLIFRANGFVQSINLVTILVSNSLLLFMHILDKVYWDVLWLMKQKLKFIPRFFRQTLLLFRQSSNEKDGKKWNVIRLLKTFAITFIVLVFFTQLLSSADPVFEQMIATVREQAFGRIFISLFLSFFAIVFFSMRVETKEEDRFTLKMLSFHDIFFPLLSMIVLFGVFLGIQANYLFGSHADLQSFGLTYSEYVRKGFTELLFTAFVGGLIALIAVLKARMFSDKRTSQIQLLNTALIIELFFMLGSALKRDLMYVDVYGLTRVRIVGGVFLAWLAVLLLLLLIMTLIKKMKEQSFFIGIGIASICVVAAFNILNMDQMVVRGAPSHHIKTIFTSTTFLQMVWKDGRNRLMLYILVFKNLPQKRS